MGGGGVGHEEEGNQAKRKFNHPIGIFVGKELHGRRRAGEAKEEGRGEIRPAADLGEMIRASEVRRGKA